MGHVGHVGQEMLTSRGAVMTYKEEVVEIHREDLRGHKLEKTRHHVIQEQQ